MIQTKDVVHSVAEALQYISYYHPKDFIEAMHAAYQKESSDAARNAIAQILVNSRMSALGKRPLCQDTGLVVAFAKVGMGAQFEGDMTLQEMLDEGTRRAYTSPENPLRASVLSPPYGARKNTRDNTPAVLHVEMVPGDGLELHLAAKGGGSENKAKFAMLNPADDIEAWVLEQVSQLGAGWCPPGIIGLGIGGSPEKALLMAKESLMAPVDIHTLKGKAEPSQDEQLRLNLYEKINQLGIGAQGLGGDTTVLDVKVQSYPTHAASMPVALIPNCAATRHIHFHLDGSGAATFTPPALSDWPEISATGSDEKRIHLDDAEIEGKLKSLRMGDTVLLSGKILTGRDAAHKRIQDMLAAGENLTDHGLDFTGRLIYYVGPVDPVGDEVVGPAGPTTSGRMDRYTEMMLGECGLAGMIGKSERNQATVDLIQKHQSIYFIAVGGAAFLVAKAIQSSRVVAFEDLGMEAVYEFEVKDMPVTVAVDSLGQSVHTEGPKQFRVTTI